MSTRRSSNYGRDDDRPRPFQVYTEAISTGKNLGATKKKIKWRYGWTDQDVENEIEFIHSLVSGKRVKYLRFKYLVILKNLRNC